MSGYIGSTPVPQATQHRESFTCTEGQTSFATAGYTAQFVDVYLNGSHLSPADFTATNGSDVVLGVAASADDVCDVISYSAFEVAGATFTGTTTMDVSLTTGVLTANGGAVFNEGSADVDFRVESDSSTHALFVQGSNGNVGIGVSAPSMALDVAGACTGGGQGGANVLQTLYDTTSYALGVGGGIGFAGNFGTGGNVDGTFATINGVKENATDANFAGAMTFKTRVNGGSLTERMRIDSSGNVGIGTGSPSGVGGRIVEISSANTISELHLTNSTSGSGAATGLTHILNGVDAYAYNRENGAYIFGTNNAERMRIDSSGAVTMPVQPAFQAHKNGTDQSNIAVGSDVTVTWSHEAFDQNADFASNAFTAPVTGKYQLNLMMRLEAIDSASSYYVVRITTSNQAYSHIVDPDYGQDNVYYPVQISVLADMDSSDTAYVSITQGSGTAQTEIDGNREYTSFSGYLVA